VEERSRKPHADRPSQPEQRRFPTIAGSCPHDFVFAIPTVWPVTILTSRPGCHVSGLELPSWPQLTSIGMDAGVKRTIAPRSPREIPMSTYWDRAPRDPWLASFSGSVLSPLPLCPRRTVAVERIPSLPWLRLLRSR